jgi:hypothetical protein
MAMSMRQTEDNVDENLEACYLSVQPKAESNMTVIEIVTVFGASYPSDELVMTIEI